MGILDEVVGDSKQDGSGDLSQMEEVVIGRFSCDANENSLGDNHGRCETSLGVMINLVCGKRGCQCWQALVWRKY